MRSLASIHNMEEVVDTLKLQSLVVNSRCDLDQHIARIEDGSFTLEHAIYGDLLCAEGDAKLIAPSHHVDSIGLTVMNLLHFEAFDLLRFGIFLAEIVDVE